MKKLQFIIPPVIVIVLAVAAFSFMKMQGDGTDTMSENKAANNMEQTEKMPAEADKKATEGDKMGAGDGTASSSKDSMAGAKLAGSRIDLQSINKLNPGAVTLAFKLYGKDTKELEPKDLKNVNDKPVHLFVSRDDLTVFEHLYPEYINDRWTVTTQIAQAGNYNLYVDVAPVAEGAVVLRLPVVIGEATMKKNYPKGSPEFAEMSGEYTAQADLKTPIKAGVKTEFGIKLTQEGKSVSEIGAYAGGFGQALVLMHTEPEHYDILRSLTTTQPMDGTVRFEVDFPVNGMYTIFAQFNINGQVKTFPITVEVGENDGKSLETGM